MPSALIRPAALVAYFVATARALTGIKVPESVSADSSFQATFSNGDSDNYRVYLAASLAGVNGPTCTRLRVPQEWSHSNIRQAI